MRIGSILALLMFVVGCTEGGTLFVRHVPLVAAGDSCVASAGPASPSVTLGLHDKSLSSTHIQSLLVGNIEDNGGVQLSEAEVTVHDLLGNTLASFTQVISGFVDAGSEDNPAYGLTRLVLLDPATVALIDTSIGGQTVASRVTVRGRSLNDDEVSSRPWDFPVFVCGAAGHYTCVPLVEPVSCDDYLEVPCQPGQDTAHDARYVEAMTGLDVSDCTM